MDHQHHHTHQEQTHRNGHTINSTHDAHAGHHTEDFLHTFWVVLLLTVPLVLYSDLPQAFFGWSAPHFAGVTYITALIGSIVFFYGGSVFLKGAWREIRARMPGMMTLIAVAISAAYFYSIGVLFFGHGMTLFWELATLVDVMLIGHYIEMRAVQGARGAMQELAKLLPDTAEVLHNGIPTTVLLSQLVEGDVVLIRPGSRIPVDGVVIRGESEVDESVITGESRPVSKHQGSEVVAGSLNGDGSIDVRVTNIGEHTFLAGIMRLVAEAERSKSRLQLLSDRVAFYLTLVAIISSGVTFSAWIIAGQPFGFAVERLVAVLVIACPHALGLAIPLVASISTTIASRNGFLIRNRLSLETARTVDMVLFDKTGTLTHGSFGIIAIIGDEQKTIALASAANQTSEHPLGRAIVDYARHHTISIPYTTAFSNVRGKGVHVEIDAKQVFVGSATFLSEYRINIPEVYQHTIHTHEQEGKTVIHVIEEEKWIGSIALADVIRDTSRETVRMLNDMGIRVTMITGDSEDVAKWVSKELGIEEYFARVLPSQKADVVKSLQARGMCVAMVGDGVNDAPALTQADVGIAIGAGTNVAIESAGIILIKNDPRDIPKIIHLSRITYRKMIENLFWASGYNIIALPVAAGAFAHYGIMLQPAFAAVFMSLSTVVVAFNAMLLRGKNMP